MNSFGPKDFETVLDTLGKQVDNVVQCDNVRSIGGNLNTRGMSYKDRDDPHRVGTVIVGEDKGYIAVDITMLDGGVRGFSLRGTADEEGMGNIVDWFEHNYS